MALSRWKFEVGVRTITVRRLGTLLPSLKRCPLSEANADALHR
jgi:hypothetical protein